MPGSSSRRRLCRRRSSEWRGGGRLGLWEYLASRQRRRAYLQACHEYSTCGYQKVSSCHASIPTCHTPLPSHAPTPPRPSPPGRRYILQTYARPELVFVYGEGARMYDAYGREYLDFAAGIAVNALGGFSSVNTAPTGLHFGCWMRE